MGVVVVGGGGGGMPSRCMPSQGSVPVGLRDSATRGLSTVGAGHEFQSYMQRFTPEIGIFHEPDESHSLNII